LEYRYLGQNGTNWTTFAVENALRISTGHRADHFD